MAENIRLANLSGVSEDILYASFTEAFSDYLVSVNMDRTTFSWNNALRGFSGKVSVGAFYGDRLVGFILSGSGIWHGRRAAYDMGTGVIPSYRGRGLADSLIKVLWRELLGAGIEVYVLEVLKENAPAVKLYRKNGFRETRGLFCLSASRDALLSSVAGSVLPSGFELRPLASIPESIDSFCDYEPSWQNSSAALRRYPGPLLKLGVYRGQELAGYGVGKLAGGDIPQLAVKPCYRRRGIGGALLAAISSAMKDRTDIRIINGDERDAAFHAFLTKRGFKSIGCQFEMEKPVTP